MVKQQLIQHLQNLSPSFLELHNESMNHAGYFEGKESHFKLTIVSDKFMDKRPVARHQLVYGAVQSLLTQCGGTVHALAIHAYTPTEWQTQLAEQGNSPASPQCAGQHH